MRFNYSHFHTFIFLFVFFIKINKTTATEIVSGKIYDGYVVKIEGDTLFGQLQMLTPSLNQVKIKFISKDGEKQLFKAKELKSYAFQVPLWNPKQEEYAVEWVCYVRKKIDVVPVPFSSNEVLLQREVHGTVSYYNCYVEARSDQSLEHIIFLEKDDILYTVNKDNYRNVLKILFADFPFLKEKIGKKGYSFKDLKATVEEYNFSMKNWTEAKPN